MPPTLKEAIVKVRRTFLELEEKPTAIGVQIRSDQTFKVWLPGTKVVLNGQGINLGVMSPGIGTHSMVPHDSIPGAFTWDIGKSP